MGDFSIGTALLYFTGLAVIIFRLRALLRPNANLASNAAARSLSIIIPARNEAHNLPTLLGSLLRLDPPASEIIVVDDHSTDETASIARSFGAVVVTPPPLPQGWLGKPWACHHGGSKASGELLLFADADTIFSPDLLARACDRMDRSQSVLLSVVPTHVIVTLWERLQASFHLLLLIATRAGGPATSDRLFAIGQFLLFRRDHYEAIGGHAAVRDRVAEDLRFAQLTMARGRPYHLLMAPGALQVRMYPEGFGGFVRGWRRNFREGLSSTGAGGVIEVSLAIIAFLGPTVWILQTVLRTGDLSVTNLVIFSVFFAASTLVTARFQQAVGAVSPLAALAHPLFVVVFVGISLLAAIDRIRCAPVTWKGRAVRLPSQIR